MILWSRVNELRDEVGPEDFKEVIDRFRGDTDRGQLEQDLHFLKGSALNLGFAEFSDMCQSGERLAAAGKADTVDLAAIVDSYDRSKIAFFDGLQDNAA